MDKRTFEKQVSVQAKSKEFQELFLKQSQSHIVTIRTPQRTYQSTYATLKKSPYFAVLHDKEIELNNFEHMGTILNYLRDSTLPFSLDSLSEANLRSLHNEAKTLKIEKLCNDIVEYCNFLDPGPFVNILNHHRTGGTCKIAEYTCYNGASIYNPGTVEGGITDSWQNLGCLVDEGEFPPENKITKSYKTNQNSGSTWYNAQDAVGVIVVDMSSSFKHRKISRLYLFQMISDGMCTHFKISYHRENLFAPAYNDANWIPLSENWMNIGAAVGANNQDGFHVTDATVTYDLPEPIRTRYLKIEIKNDGTLGNNNYIEIRQIKAISRRQNDESVFTQ